jgi:STE24 endopeptidase
VIVAVLVQVVCAIAARQMDRRGSLRAVNNAERALAASRLVIVGLHAAAVFSSGWLEQIRGVVGTNWELVSEFLAIVPPVITIIAGWWSFYPIERRLRESMWVRILDTGAPAYPMQTRVQFVWSNIRHQMLFVLLPLMLIGAWGHVWRWVLRNDGPGLIGEFGRWVRYSGLRDSLQVGGQLFGVLVVLAVSPLMMRWVWDAVPLGPGPLRDKLMGLCTRAGVRVRGLLVWRTHGTMLNGVAMGLAAPMRYIMLTDALLDQLPERQVESVMGHEVGHAKHHHIPWMVGALAGILGLCTIATSVVAVVFYVGVSLVLNGRFAPPGAGLSRGGQGPIEVVTGGVTAVVTLATLGFALMAFGWVSRRFEWQADAFAAKALSMEQPGSTVVTQESVEAMAGALESVARLNHISPERRSFRHGSIAHRQRRLHRLVGVPLDRMPIDSTCRWIKGGIVAGVFVVLLAVAAQGMLQRLVEPRPMYGIPHWWSTEQSRLEDAP